MLTEKRSCLTAAWQFQWSSSQVFQASIRLPRTPFTRQPLFALCLCTLSPHTVFHTLYLFILSQHAVAFLQRAYQSRWGAHVLRTGELHNWKIQFESSQTLNKSACSSERLLDFKLNFFFGRIAIRPIGLAAHWHCSMVLLIGDVHWFCSSVLFTYSVHFWHRVYHKTLTESNGFSFHF